mgnify:FL=1
MIKAEDLRIGDLVRVSCNCSLAEGTIGTIVEISKETNAEDTKGFIRLIPINSISNYGWGIYCDNIEGIPLTLEILEKNGWKKRTEGWYFMMISKYMYLSVEFGYENGIRVFLKRTTDGLYVKLNIANNVHELQHILWALGLDANLKI